MTKPKTPKKSKGIYVALASLALVVCIFIAAIISAVSSPGIIRNVSVNGISLKGLTLSSAKEKLEHELPLDFGTLSLCLGTDTSRVDSSAFIKGYDYEKSAQNALDITREGNIFSRAFDVISTTLFTKDIPAEIFYDEEALYKDIENILKNETDLVEEFSFEVLDDSLLFHTGHEGSVPDKTVIAENLLDAVRRADYVNTITFEHKIRQPEDINADEFLKTLSQTAQNATYHIGADGKVFAEPHKNGIILDEADFRRLVSENRGPDKTFSVKAEIIKPEFTKETLESRIFTKTLSSYTTHYNTGDVSRSKNVALAAKLIDGTILLPDEEFSYNGTVGERTAENGFSIAHVYVNGETVDGLGGGICQVSSTLYNAVLYSDLKVTERLNHQLTVGYVPLGQDATVDYGNIDFKFVNNTGYPIKIDSKTTGGGTLKVTLYGYRDDPTFNVKIQNNTISIIPPSEKEVEDPTLPEGERKIEKTGGNGAVVETYKTVTRNGETKTTFVSKSTYGAGKSIVLVGTGPAEEMPAEGEQPPEGTTLPEGNLPPAETENNHTPSATSTPENTVPSAPSQPGGGDVTPNTPISEEVSE